MGSQVDYNKFYDELRRYATTRAYRLFSDMGLRDEAIDKALDEAGAELMERRDIENPELFSKGVIRNSLKMSARDRKLDLAPTTDKLTQEGRIILGDATRIKQVVYKGKYPKVILTEIENQKERRICLDYWQYGLTVKEIAQKMSLTPRRIRQVIAKHAR